MKPLVIRSDLTSAELRSFHKELARLSKESRPTSYINTLLQLVQDWTRDDLRKMSPAEIRAIHPIITQAIEKALLER